MADSNPFERKSIEFETLEQALYGYSDDAAITFMMDGEPLYTTSKREILSHYGDPNVDETLLEAKFQNDDATSIDN